MNRIVILLALAGILAGAHAATHDKAYKWVDENGVVHFSDAPPPSDTKNVQSVHIINDTPVSAQAAGTETKPAEDKPKQASTGVPDNAENRAKECEQAKRNLALLQSNYSVSEIGPDGKVKAIDDKDRSARIAGVNDRIAQFCGK